MTKVDSRIVSRSVQTVILVLLVLYPDVVGGQEQARSSTDESFRIMTWNIWHGGREDGEQDGPRRVSEVIIGSGADIVAMQETYGSGEIISESLGFNFQLRGTNLSIHSRFPIIEDISVFEEFKCNGALIELPDESLLAFYCIWLPYEEDIWLPFSREKYDDQQLLPKCNVSRDDLEKILNEIRQRLSEDKYRDVSLVIAGDFNSMSHLDYAELSRDQFGHVVPWPTSRLIIGHGLRDAYREVNPVVDRAADATWSPKFVEQEQDRIDFVYYSSDRWRARRASVVREHAEWFPSDHAAVVCEFGRISPEKPQTLRAVTYNIRHGAGSDDKLFLVRSAGVLNALQPDFVALQEVDNGCRRSGGVNQAALLGQRLGMHATFEKFMDYDEGRYGMATLSRFPVVGQSSIELPEGGEPRIALVTDVRLPDDNVVSVVNVHLDWVNDDGIRFQQAQVLVQQLKQMRNPWILMGDFNDQPDSRTLQLIGEIGINVAKPAGENLTFPASDPTIELDYVFCSSAHKSMWGISGSGVIREPVASDHRPVLAEIRWKPDREMP